MDWTWRQKRSPNWTGGWDLAICWFRDDWLVITDWEAAKLRVLPFKSDKLDMTVKKRSPYQTRRWDLAICRVRGDKKSILLSFHRCFHQLLSSPLFHLYFVFQTTFLLFSHRFHRSPPITFLISFLFFSFSNSLNKEDLLTTDVNKDC